MAAKRRPGKGEKGGGELTPHAQRQRPSKARYESVDGDFFLKVFLDKTDPAYSDISELRCLFPSI